MKLRLSEDYVIDTDDYRKEGLRIAVLAMSGHGKSNAAADIVEDVLDQKGQAIVLEPITEWHTLKARYNNVVTVGGEFQDLPLEQDFSREYVHASLENGVNARARRLQATGHCEHDCFLFKIVSAIAFPLIAWNWSKVDCWKFLVGSIPISWKVSTNPACPKSENQTKFLLVVHSVTACLVNSLS